MGRPEAPCGTDSAYRRHLRNGDTVDDACRLAHTEAQRARRRSPAAAPPAAPDHDTAGDDSRSTDDAEVDDLDLIVATLRAAFQKVAKDDPTKVAPIAREFRAAVEAKRGPAEPPKELTLAEQLAEARAARAARAQSQGATA